MLVLSAVQLNKFHYAAAWSLARAAHARSKVSRARFLIVFLDPWLDYGEDPACCFFSSRSSCSGL